MRATIDLLKAVIKDPNCRKMNKSTVVGYLGELLVKEKLESEGFSVTHRGNQSRDDLQYEKQGTAVIVDVKCSLCKWDFSKEVANWGWALQPARLPSSTVHRVHCPKTGHSH